MTADQPRHTPEPQDSPDDVPAAALDEDAKPAGGAEPDTAGDQTVEPGPPTRAARVILEGAAATNEQMRRGTEDLRSSQDKSAQAREFADEVARTTGPEPPARPGDEV